MDGIHPLVSIYFQHIKIIAENAYERYLYLSQPNRIGVRPEESSEECVYRFIERALRVVTFTTVPDQIAKASQQVGQNTCTDMLFNTMIGVAPGNKADRESVYMEVITKKECEPRAMHDQFHRWKFSFNRLTRLGFKEPDPSLQLDALTAMSKKWVASDFTFAYRLSSFLDTTNCFGLVTQEQVEALWTYLVTEARDIAKGPISNDVHPKVKAVKVPNDKDPKSAKVNTLTIQKLIVTPTNTVSTTQPACRYWKAPSVCRAGTACPFSHPRIKQSEKRCYNCGSSEHMSPQRERRTSILTETTKCLHSWIRNEGRV